MNIQELQAERDALEKRLRKYIQSELQQFQEYTKIGMSSINILLIDVKEIYGTKVEYLVNNVQVELDI